MLMKIETLRNKTEIELKDFLNELLREQFNLRMQKGMGEMPRPHFFQKVRRDIARIKTLLNEMEQYNNE